MATIPTTRKDFDFDAYNLVMKNANAGLKLFLVEQLLTDIGVTAARYRNPLQKDIFNLVDEVSTTRTEWKAIAAKAQNQTPEGRPTTPADRPAFDANQFEPAIY